MTQPRPPTFPDEVLDCVLNKLTISDAISTRIQPSLPTLPDELLDLVIEDFTIADLISLSRTCKQLRPKIKARLSKCYVLAETILAERVKGVKSSLDTKKVLTYFATSWEGHSVQLKKSLHLAKRCARDISRFGNVERWQRTPTMVRYMIWWEGF